MGFSNLLALEFDCCLVRMLVKNKKKVSVTTCANLIACRPRCSHPQCQCLLTILYRNSINTGKARYCSNQTEISSSEHIYDDICTVKCNKHQFVLLNVYIITIWAPRLCTQHHFVPVPGSFKIFRSYVLRSPFGNHLIEIKRFEIEGSNFGDFHN